MIAIVPSVCVCAAPINFAACSRHRLIFRCPNKKCCRKSRLLSAYVRIDIYSRRVQRARYTCVNSSNTHTWPHTSPFQKKIDTHFHHLCAFGICTRKGGQVRGTNLQLSPEKAHGHFRCARFMLHTLFDSIQCRTQHTWRTSLSPAHSLSLAAYVWHTKSIWFYFYSIFLSAALVSTGKQTPCNAINLLRSHFKTFRYAKQINWKRMKRTRRGEKIEKIKIDDARAQNNCANREM